MALSGRIRSFSLPLLHKFLKSGSISTHGSPIQRSQLCLPLNSSEQLSLLQFITLNTFSAPFQSPFSSPFSRNYATESGAKEEKVKVPLALFGGSGNYATALYISAVKANALDIVESEILDFVEASKRSENFSQFLKNSSVPRDARVKAVTAILSETKFSDVTKNFLVVLAENGRLRNLERIAKRFLELTMAHKGEVKAVVTSVIPLPPEEEKELKETLQDLIGHGKKVKLEQKIDPSILGGLMVEFDHKVFDMSIKTRAKQMERFLRAPINSDSL